MREGATHHPSLPFILSYRTEYIQQAATFKKENGDFHTSVIAIVGFLRGEFCICFNKQVWLSEAEQYNSVTCIQVFEKGLVWVTCW